MIRRTTTICGGVAIVLHLLLPAAHLAATSASQDVPAAPAPAPVPQTSPPPPSQTPLTPPAAPLPVTPAPAAPDASAGPYERAWTVSVVSEGGASGPIALAIATGLVVLAAENRPLEARSLEDGAVRWTSPATMTAPVVGEGLLFGVGGGELRAVALEKGQPLWTVALAGATPGPGVIADLVVVSSGPELRAYRAADGAAVWRHALPAPAVERPFAAGQLVVVALAGNEVAAFDRETGGAVWRTPLDSAPSLMAASPDRIFFGTASGAVCALRLADGKLSQCFRTAPVPSAGAPVVHGASVFFALFDNTLRAFTADGLTLTRLEPLPARPARGPLRAGSHLAIPLATSAFALAALDAPGAVTLVSAFEKATGPVFQDAAAAPDGSWLVSLSIDPSARLSLVGYRRTPAAPPSPNK